MSKRDSASSSSGSDAANTCRARSGQAPIGSQILLRASVVGTPESSSHTGTEKSVPRAPFRTRDPAVQKLALTENGRKETLVSEDVRFEGQERRQREITEEFRQ